MKRSLVIMAFALLATALSTRTAAVRGSTDNGDRVVLITVDGARTQEVFGGLDVEVLKSTLKDPLALERSPEYAKYWAPSPEERRHKLMPFFWDLVSRHGSIAGNASLGSAVRLANRHGFSYPGYAEILLGEPHDDIIKSNDSLRNPYVTVLETVRERLSLPARRVATFASWGIFNDIVEHVEGSTFVNAGVEALKDPGETVRLLNRMEHETSTPWEVTRFDAFTFRLAMAYLASARPRVLYLAFGETDDWAHDGRYDRVLEAYGRIDGYLSELWTWLQNQPDYRGRTHLLITTDHGRGETPADWRHHRASVEGSENVWMAFASPRMARRGEWHDSPPLSSSQIAATLAGWLGVDWNADHPNAGKPVR